jgi:hypothetical protein
MRWSSPMEKVCSSQAYMKARRQPCSSSVETHTAAEAKKREPGSIIA